MVRRGFEHLVAEVSVATGHRVARYPLWLRMRELGLDPDRLAPGEALAFCRRHLRTFLAEHGVPLTPQAARRLERAVARFDPRRPSPEEWIARL